MSLPEEISVAELKRMRDAGSNHILLDVRDDDELATSAIAGVTHIPMPEVPLRLDEVPKDRDVVVMCHGGGRSARVATYLRENGFTSVANLAGGIDAWAQQIDPTVPRY